MSREETVRYITGAAIVVLLILLLAMHGRGLLADYGWVLFPGIFVLAIVARVIDGAYRRRRLRKFRGR